MIMLSEFAKTEMPAMTAGLASEEDRNDPRRPTGPERRLPRGLRHATEIPAQSEKGESPTVATKTLGNNVLGGGAAWGDVPRTRNRKETAPSASEGAEAQRVLRVHFTREILSALQKIQAHCGQPQAAAYADTLLRSMRTMRDFPGQDRFLEVILALHDALAADNRWADYTADQYAGAYRLLKEIAGRSNIPEKVAEKAIMGLENLGFDTTPFTLPDTAASAGEDGTTSEHAKHPEALS